MLITESEVEAAAAAGKTRLHLSGGAVVTPLARDRAEELGVQLVVGCSTTERECSPGPARAEEVRALVHAVLARLSQPADDEEAVVSAVLQRLGGGRCGGNGG